MAVFDCNQSSFLIETIAENRTEWVFLVKEIAPAVFLRSRSSPYTEEGEEGYGGKLMMPKSQYCENSPSTHPSTCSSKTKTGAHTKRLKIRL